MQTFTFYKANVSPDAPDNATTIEISASLPDSQEIGFGDLESWQYLEQSEARKLNAALRRALPGGVYHRLLGQMMLTQAIDWMVPVVRDNEGA